MAEAKFIETLDEWWTVFDTAKIELVYLHNQLFTSEATSRFVSAIDKRVYSDVYEALDSIWWAIHHDAPIPEWKTLCRLLDSLVR